jgi:hypothetical protein
MAFSILSNIFWGIAKLHVLGIKILGTLRDALIMAKEKQPQKNPIQNKNVNMAKKMLWQKKHFRKRSIHDKKKHLKNKLLHIENHIRQKKTVSEANSSTFKII